MGLHEPLREGVLVLLAPQNVLLKLLRQHCGFVVTVEVGTRANSLAQHLDGFGIGYLPGELHIEKVVEAVHKLQALLLLFLGGVEEVLWLFLLLFEEGQSLVVGLVEVLNDLAQFLVARPLFLTMVV